MKKRLFISLFAVVLMVAMVLPMASCTTNPDDPNNTQETTAGTTAPNGGTNTPDGGTTVKGTYTYEDAVSQLSNNWNPHTYQTSDASYPADFMYVGLYGFFFNDEVTHKSSTGAAAFEGYVIAPEMAAEFPVDVTEEVKASHPQYNIPESATAGYAYKIALNQNATWSNGVAINADTYVYSMQQVLNPLLKNYRGADYFGEGLPIANGANYYYQGSSTYIQNYNNNKWSLESLTKGTDDGFYYAENGAKMYIGVNCELKWLGGYTLKTYVDAYGDEAFGMTYWKDLLAAANEDGVVALTDETLAWLRDVITTNEAWGETDGASLYAYLMEEKAYAADFSFDNVGIFKSGDYEITLVFDKSLSGFNLLYSLSSNWIVYEDLYEACKKQVGDTDAWTSTYASSIETTMSYGPYIMTNYQMDKEMTFERNTNWYGYTDGKHVYTDPEDGKVYSMYQTDVIHTQQVTESQTRKTMFLAGQLMTYGLGKEDFAEYRSSDYAHVTPSETIYFFIFNGHISAIQQREAAEGFDQSKYDLETMTLTSFRKAIAVSYNKDDLCATISPSRSGGFGLIGNNYIYDPDTGAKYRDTDQAKKVLCDFYSVNVEDFGGDLDAAVDSITGYDPTKAKALFTQAFKDALEASYITDTDGDGKSDQTVRIEYAVSEYSTFQQSIIDYLNEKITAVLEGTPFEGKIEFYMSGNLGDNWSDCIRNGMSDTVLGGWTGSALDPFGLTDLYVNPEKAFDAGWFDPTSVEMTLEIDIAPIGEEANVQTVTMNLSQWSQALNGTTVTVNGVDYCFGDGIAEVETRLTILASFEAAVLSTYDYIPMIQDGGISLLSKKAFYVVEDYNPVMGRGGLAYLRYNYNDAEWTDYVASQGGTLTY